MPAIFIKLIMKSVALLLALDGKIKVMLNDVCWFNSVTDLAVNSLPVEECLDIQMAQHWSSLWDCAAQALHPETDRHFYVSPGVAQPQQPVAALGHRKRAELAFSPHNSSLHQQVLCRHASGSDDHHHQILIPFHQAQCAFSPLCFFIA